MRCDGVLLDLDNTLYDYETRHQPALDAVLTRVRERFGIEGSAVREAFSVSRLRINRELAETAASHNRMLYFQLMFELLGINPLGNALAAYELYWTTFLDGINLDEGAQAFLDGLGERPICLVSDLTAHIQYRKIEKLGLTGRVHSLVTSEEAGREKPHPWMFVLALRKLGLTADSVCMVGDSFGKDILGASGLGIQSFWLNRTGEPRQLPASAQEVKDLREIIGQLA